MDPFWLPCWVERTECRLGRCVRPGTNLQVECDPERMLLISQGEEPFNLSKDRRVICIASRTELCGLPSPWG